MDAGERYRGVWDRIEGACLSVGRPHSEVTLVAVSKNQSVEAIRELYDLGHRDFGESRLQEAEPKIADLPKDIRWHYIGNLQSNKAKRIASLFSVIHTIDSERQLTEIAKEGAQPDALIQVNIANEPQKCGVQVEVLDDIARFVIQCSCVRFRGLMTIGPAVGDAEAMRPFFRSLREANQRAGGEWLSMGMSGDFEVAVQEGATHVRIGTALFGERVR